jgi:transposase InsO family protein
MSYKQVRFKRKCNYCAEEGHIEERCWQKSFDLKMQAKLSGDETQAKFVTMHTSPTRKEESHQDWSGDYAFCSYSFFSKVKRRNWIADSGASRHMSDQEWCFTNYVPVKAGTWPVYGIGEDSQPLQVAGIGDVPVMCCVDGSYNRGVLQKVLHIPKLGVNLFSIKAATSQGFQAVFTDCRVESIKNGAVRLAGMSNENDLYTLDVISCHGKSIILEPKMESFSALAKTTPQSVHLWHRRLGHVAVSTIKKMADNLMADGLVLSEVFQKDIVCEGCIYGKHHRLPFPTSGRTRGKKIGDLIHSDVCGPVSVSSPGGAKYFVTFKDDHSSYAVIHFIKQKSEVFELFKQFVKRVKVEIGNEVVCLRSDNGGEYVGKEFETWLLENGIRHETTVSYTPEQNGVSERLNRTVLESARSMLHFSSFPLELWAEASNCVVYLLNRVATRSVEGKTPYEVWKGVKPNLSHV